MKFYLSSYKFGNEVEKLKALIQPGSRIGHINNAQDEIEINSEMQIDNQTSEIQQLNLLGFIAEPLDLKKYFGETDELRKKLYQLNGVWVSGGNTFVLRQAMKLSGFDIVFNELKSKTDFLYSGYSAGICILCDSFKYIQNVDNPYYFPYQKNMTVIWEGLGVFSYGLLPHYNSDHFESENIGKDIETCIDNKWLFKALRDGEVIIIE